MSFLPTTQPIQKQMLKKMEVDSIDELLQIIPNNLLLKESMGLETGMSELEITEHLKNFCENTIPANNSNNYLGNGMYDHFIPAAVDAITSRSEYYTSYTPYQPEVSQGTLQCLYEYQTIICELAGMEVANASLYDGASSVSEACILAVNATNRKKILISETIYDNYQHVVYSLQNNSNIEIGLIPMKNAFTNLSKLKNLHEIAGIIIQSPNKYGVLENWKMASKLLNDTGCLLIAISNPLMLTLIESPGKLKYFGWAHNL